MSTLDDAALALLDLRAAYDGSDAVALVQSCRAVAKTLPLARVTIDGVSYQPMRFRQIIYAVLGYHVLQLIWIEDALDLIEASEDAPANSRATTPAPAPDGCEEAAKASCGGCNGIEGCSACDGRGVVFESVRAA